MALWRWWSSKEFDFSPNRTVRAVDAEIDMRRLAPRPSRIAHNISSLLRWMMPQGKSVGPPMRSVARELEEFFPIDDN